MRIEHIALWTSRLEELKAFYETYFGARAGEKYINPTKQFESYFLSFSDGARLELMRVPGIAGDRRRDEQAGYHHIAFAVGSREQVDALTERLRGDGYRVVGEPRRTGDGYYESVVLDPDGNRVEITY
ncbi:MAG: glyoxalase [Herpetosiphonaceae bacterium]|nr:MAG: glyoxalase [Herpetosiphonaceae bacterium]